MQTPTDTFQVIRFLRMQPWFGALRPAQQERVLRTAQTRRAEAGTALLESQQRATGWYAVLWGFVKLQMPTRDATDAAFLALTGGEWFGEGTVLRDEPRRYEVVALRPTELLCMPREVFLDLVDTSLAFNRAVLGHMGNRLAQAMAMIEAQRTGSLEQRLGLYLGRHFWHGLRRLQLSQSELGTLAGMSRQAVNGALRGLEQRGLITVVAGRVATVDQDAMDRFVGVGPAPQPQAMRPEPDRVLRWP